MVTWVLLIQCLALVGAPCWCCNGICFPFLQQVKMIKGKVLGCKRCCKAEWLLWWPCRPGMSGALCESSQAGWRQLLPLPFCTSWTPPVMPTGVQWEESCLPSNSPRDWPLLFLFRGSKILCTGPEGRSLQILPTTTDSEYSLCGQKASSRLLPSPCWQSQIFLKCSSTVGFSLLCV